MRCCITNEYEGRLIVSPVAAELVLIKLASFAHHTATLEYQLDQVRVDSAALGADLRVAWGWDFVHRQYCKELNQVVHPPGRCQ